MKRIRKLLLKPSNLLWLLLVPVVVAAAYLLPWQEIWQTLKTLTLGELAALAVINVVILLLLGSRWWLILRAMGHTIPYLRLARYRMAGFAISYFTPGTQFGGEPLQAYLVQNRHGVPTASSVAAVTMDKLFELLANFTFLVGVAAAAVMMVIPVYIYDNEELHDLVIFGELLAVAAILMCLAFVTVDLGLELSIAS